MNQRHEYFKIDAKGKINRDEAGFVNLDVFATRSGIFLYMDSAGRIIREFRSPEEVFAKSSMGTLAKKPVTNNHPSVRFVDSKNARNYQVGWTGDTVARMEDKLFTKATITDETTINDVENGKVEVSCGYTCKHDETPGEWKGQKYDRAQTDIRYNHLAIVDRGRAGAQVRLLTDANDEPIILLDSIDYVVDHLCYDKTIRYCDKTQTYKSDKLQLCEIVVNNNIIQDEEEAQGIANRLGGVGFNSLKTDGAYRFQNKEEIKQDGLRSYPIPEQRGVTLVFGELKNDQNKNKGGQAMASININGITQEVSDSFKSVYDSQMAKVQSDAEEKVKADKEANTKALSEAQAKIDMLENEKKELKTKVDESPEKMKEYAREFSRVKSVANDLLSAEEIKKIDSMSIEEIKLAVVKSKNLKTDGKDQAYIDAAFDLVLQGKEEKEKKNDGLGKDILNNRNDGDDGNKVESARVKAMNDSQDAWKADLSMKR